MTSEGSPKTLKVATVQFRSSTDLADNLTRIRQQMEPLAAQGVRVVAFPECAVTSYSADAVEACSEQQLEDAERELAKISADLGMYMVMGIPYFEDGTRLNGSLVYDPEGKLIARYAKVQLAGERWCESGNHLVLFEVDSVVCSTMVCHDSRLSGDHADTGDSGRADHVLHLVRVGAPRRDEARTVPGTDPGSGSGKFHLRCAEQRTGELRRGW